MFSDVYRGYQKRSVAWNGLRTLLTKFSIPLRTGNFNCFETIDRSSFHFGLQIKEVMYMTWKKTAVNEHIKQAAATIFDKIHFRSLFPARLLSLVPVLLTSSKLFVHINYYYSGFLSKFINILECNIGIF